MLVSATAKARGGKMGHRRSMIRVIIFFNMRFIFLVRWLTDVLLLLDCTVWNSAKN
jgi:hypothetical protein